MITKNMQVGKLYRVIRNQYLMFYPTREAALKIDYTYATPEAYDVAFSLDLRDEISAVSFCGDIIIPLAIVETTANLLVNDRAGWIICPPTTYMHRWILSDILRDWEEL